MGRYPSSRKAETHGRIVSAAGQLFRTDGYVGTGVAKLMGAAGLTVGGFYAHFESKEALLREVLAEALQQTRHVLLAGLDDVEGEAFVQEVARRYLSRQHRDEVASGCAIPSLAPDVARRGEDTQAEFEAYFRKLTAALEPHLAEVTDELSPRDRVYALTALLVGGLTLSRAVKSKKLSDRILLACRRFATVKEQS